MSDAVELDATNMQCSGEGQSSKVGPPSPVNILLTTMSIVHWNTPRGECTGDWTGWHRFKDWDSGSK